MATVRFLWWEAQLPEIRLGKIFASFRDEFLQAIRVFVINMIDLVGAETAKSCGGEAVHLDSFSLHCSFINKLCVETKVVYLR